MPLKNLPKLSMGPFGQSWGYSQVRKFWIKYYLISNWIKAFFQVIDQNVFSSNKITGYLDHQYLWKKTTNVIDFLYTYSTQGKYIYDH